MPRNTRKLLAIALVVIVLGFLVYRSRGALRLGEFDWSQLKDSILRVNPAHIAASVGGIYAAYALRALRWKRFSRYLGDLPFLSLFKATLVGFSAIFLLGRAGEPVRPLLIAKKERIPVSSSFGIYVLERVFDLASTVVIAGLSLLTFPRLFSEGNGQGSSYLTAIRAAGTGMLVGLPVMVGFLIYFRLHGATVIERRIADWRAKGRLLGWRGRVAGLVEGFSRGLQAIRTMSDLGAAAFYSFAHWLVIILIYYWVCQSFGGRLAEVGIAGAMLALAFSMVGSTVQLPGVGGGSQVACFVALSVVLGVEREPAAAAAIVIWLITFAACCLAGVPLSIQEGWSMGELRRLARAEADAEARGSHVNANGG